MTFPVMDNFNRPDEANVGGNWTQVTGSASTISLVSGQLSRGSGSDTAVYWNRETPANDQYAYCDSASATCDAGPIIRAQVGSFGFYGFNINTNLKYKFVSGVFTQYATTSATWTVGDECQISVVGTDTKIWKNGVLIQGPHTDSSLTSGSIGVYIFFGQIDNWGGGEITTSAAPVAWLTA